MRTPGRLWLGAPALMVLATCVTSQVALADGDEASDPSMLHAPGLSWAVGGGVTHSVEKARQALARKAAHVIHTLDRIACARAFAPVPLAVPLPVARVTRAVIDTPGLPARLDPRHSHRQPAAP